MKNNIKLILFIFVLIFLVNIVNAELTFEKNSQVDLKVPCFKNGALCSSSTTCNITSNYPDTSNLINNQQMTRTGSYYNFTINADQINQTGDYQNTVYCSDTIDSNFNTFIFKVTNTGTQSTTSESIIYIILMVVILLLFGLGLYFSFAIPWENKVRNERGGIVKITYLRYIKIVMMMITYLLFLWFLNALVGLSNNYVSLGLYYGFFSVLFSIFLVGAYIFELTMIVIFVINIVKDFNVKERIRKFGEVF